MPKKNFEATQGLLEDVMRKQAGSVEKAVLEAVMNSVDAGADNITISVEEGRMAIKDDGTGMTGEEIDNYFRQFGLKDSDIEEKEFGKFRMGRGQIFNFGLNIWATGSSVLVVNLNEDETEVTIQGEEHNLDTEGLSYHVIDREEMVEGCTIEVQFYELLEDVDDTINEIKKLIKYIPWLHDVDVTVNGEGVYHEMEPDEESKNSYYSFDPAGYSKRVYVYNKGAYVKRESIGECGGVVITKNDLDVNFSRNDILDNDPYWREVKEEFNSMAVDHMLDNRDSLSKRQRSWLVKSANEDDVVMAKVREEPIIEDVSGSYWSLEEVASKRVSFTNSRNKQAADVMERSGTLVLDEYYKEGLVSQHEAQLIDYEDLVEDEMKFEFKNIPDDDLSKKRVQRLNDLRSILRSIGFDGDVSGGYSRQQEVWKNKEGNMFIHRDTLNTPKEMFVTDVLFEVVKVAAHDGSTIEGMDEDHRFLKRYHQMMERLPQHLRTLL